MENKCKYTEYAATNIITKHVMLIRELHYEYYLLR